jgi:hypothetical protein
MPVQLTGCKGKVFCKLRWQERALVTKETHRMNNWAVQELQYADLGDVRRNKRLIRLVSDLAAQPNASVTQASGDCF